MKNIYYLLCLLFPLSVMGQEPTGKSQWVYSDANGTVSYTHLTLPTTSIV